MIRDILEVIGIVGGSVAAVCLATAVVFRVALVKLADLWIKGSW